MTTSRNPDESYSTAGMPTVVTRSSDPHSILAEWNQLAARIGTRFSSRPSYALSASITQNANELAVITVHRGGELVALAPFYTRDIGPFTLARPMGHALGMVSELLAVDAAAADVLWDAVAEYGLVVHADEVTRSDPAIARLLVNVRWKAEVSHKDRALVIELPRGTRARNLRSPGTLKRLRKARRQLDGLGTPLVVETISTVAEFEARWDDMRRVSAAAIAVHDRLDYLSGNLGEFSRQFLMHEAEAGRLIVAGLIVDGKWSAHLVAVRTGSTIEGWLTHYDPALAKFQPGQQLIEWFTNHHDELGVDRFDLGAGENQMKLAWAQTDYDAVTVIAVPRTMRGGWLAIKMVRVLEDSRMIGRIRTVVRDAKKLVKRS